MPDFSAITNYLAYLESGTNRKLRTEYDNFDPHLPRVLAKIAPFDKLDSTVLDGIVNKLEPLRYRMGQAILVKENLPARIAILYDGQARLLGYPPGAIAPQTLEKLEPGAIIGATSVIRGVPCETVIASTETVCLTLKVADFQELLEEERGRGREGEGGGISFFLPFPHSSNLPLFLCSLFL